ncbi:TPA: type I toxin-antitoxin system Fst family toxin [Staphylococcus aureus]|nr:type I toxin-antitoxin system Fst family toxin [Staphylococcus aureus]HCG2377642.1 type I toxin-antitoxin system Fst family toxin [Staphylococcus aureus]
MIAPVITGCIVAWSAYWLSQRNK